MPTQPWTEKYRPKIFADLVGPVVGQLEKLSKTPIGKIPHLIFYGPSGSGKNSSISIFLKQIYGPHFETHTKFLNASDERGIDTIRNHVKKLAQSHSDHSLPFFVVFDEADNLTEAAQQALRRTMEKYTKTSRFCFLCNHLSNINFAIQSRTERFHFSRLSDKETLEILQRVIKTENVSIESKQILQIVDYCSGDLRIGINFLQIAATQAKITQKPITSDLLTYLSGDLKDDLWEQLILPLSNEKRIMFADTFVKEGINFKYLLKRIKNYVIQTATDALVISKFLSCLAELEREMLDKIPIQLLFKLLIFYFQDICVNPQY